MGKQTSTGLIFSVVADVPATDDQAGYEALTFVQVKEVTNVPQFGPTVAVVESNPLETGITEKFKGFTNYGSTSVDFDLDPDDAGQQLMAEGAVGTNKFQRHSFKVEYSDGAIRYFQGKIFSDAETPGSANSMLTGMGQIEIETPVLRIAAP